MFQSPRRAHRAAPRRRACVHIIDLDFGWIGRYGVCAGDDQRGTRRFIRDADAIAWLRAHNPLQPGPMRDRGALRALIGWPLVAAISEPAGRPQQPRACGSPELVCSMEMVPIRAPL
jgi:hypothetical protein